MPCAASGAEDFRLGDSPMASATDARALAALDKILRTDARRPARKSEPLLEENLKFALLTEEQEVRDDALELGQLLLREVFRRLDRALVVTCLI